MSKRGPDPNFIPVSEFKTEVAKKTALERELKHARWQLQVMEQIAKYPDCRDVLEPFLHRKLTKQARAELDAKLPPLRDKHQVKIVGTAGVLALRLLRKINGGGIRTREEIRTALEVVLGRQIPDEQEGGAFVQFMLLAMASAWAAGGTGRLTSTSQRARSIRQSRDRGWLESPVRLGARKDADDFSCAVALIAWARLLELGIGSLEVKDSKRPHIEKSR